MSASIALPWINWELDEVARRIKRLVPVMISDTPKDKLPRQIGEIHIVPADGLFYLTGSPRLPHLAPRGIGAFYGKELNEHQSLRGD